MTRRKVLIVGMVSVALLTLLAMINFVYAQESGPQSVEAVLGTAFTYQGQLKNGETEVTGSCDMAFRLYDAVTVGNPIGTPITQTVAVNAGLFTTQLDFGASAFNGQARWLEIAVKCGSDATFTTLSRQALTAAPYALYATTAGSAPWSGLTSVPAGFTDGVDNDTTYTAGDGLELTGTQFRMRGTSYQNVVIVAKSGGDYTTISAALTSITNASETNHYLVKVMPGVYTETVTMKQYVDIEGAGELATTITRGGSSVIGSAGTVVGADNAQLRFLTVVNTGGNTYAVAIYNDSASPRLTHVTALASGATNINRGVYNYSSSPTMTSVTATASGGTSAYGVYNNNSSSTMTDVTATASAGANNRGLYNDNSTATLSGGSFTARGGTSAAGIINVGDSAILSAYNITALGENATTQNVGLNNSGTANLSGCSLVGHGGTSANGLRQNSVGSISTSITQSVVEGDTNAIYQTVGVVDVSNTRLVGGAVSGTVSCTLVSRGTAVNTGTTCP